MQGINDQEDTSIQRGLDGNPTGDGGGGGVPKLVIRILDMRRG